MTLEELKIVMSACLLSSWKEKDRAIKIMDREIKLKNLDPRKGKEENA